jgi:DNA replication protein DnaC
LSRRNFGFFRGHEIGRRIVESTRPGRDDDTQTLEQWLDPFRDSDCAAMLLIVDEFDKIKWTPRVATEVFELIEARTAHAAQTVITCNTSLSEICATLPENIGPAMERRLAEFSHPILFMNAEEQTAAGMSIWTPNLTTT